MPKKSVKKHSHTHNENKNHIHIHIGDKKRKNKGKRRQGRGGGGGGVVSVNSVVHPPNIVIPQYNKPQYFDPSTMAGRENSSHFAFPIPTIKHPPQTIPAGFSAQVPETVRPTEFSHQTPTNTSANLFSRQTPESGMARLGRAIEKMNEKREEKRQENEMSSENTNTHTNSIFGTNPMHQNSLTAEEKATEKAIERNNERNEGINTPRHNRDEVIPRGGRGGRGGGQRQPPDLTRIPLLTTQVVNPLTNYRITRYGATYNQLIKDGIIDKDGNDIRGKTPK